MLILNISALILSFFFMEFVAWSNHKYIMHGFLWKWHKDHHHRDGQVHGEQQEHGRFEKNDRFFIVYAIPGILLLIIGSLKNLSLLTYMGIGISLYGLTYFVVHDLIIHKRLNIPFLFKKHNFYTKAIIRAHEAHHWPNSKKDFHNYGLLIFPLRFFKS